MQGLLAQNKIAARLLFPARNDEEVKMICSCCGQQVSCLSMVGKPIQPAPALAEAIHALDAANAQIAALRQALRHIAITDDADCRIANDQAAMTRIAREALA